jgi:hypothetical protein
VERTANGYINDVRQMSTFKGVSSYHGAYSFVFEEGIFMTIIRLYPFSISWFLIVKGVPNFVCNACPTREPKYYPS